MFLIVLLIPSSWVIFIDESLSWKTHISHINKIMSRNTGVISKLRHTLPQSVLLMLYNTLILPFLSYCNIVWANTYPTKLHRLNFLQKRVVRNITLSHYQSHSRPLFKQLNILNVYQLNEYLCAILIFKNEKSLLPEKLSDMFITNSTIHNHNTRNKKKYHRWCVNTNFASYSCRHHAPEIWNLLPTNITSISFYNSFKRNLKSFLIAHDSHWMYLSSLLPLSLSLSLSLSFFPFAIFSLFHPTMLYIMYWVCAGCYAISEWYYPKLYLLLVFLLCLLYLIW